MYTFVKVQNMRLHIVQFASRCIFTDSTKCSTSREFKFMNKLIKQGHSKRDPLVPFSETYGQPKPRLSLHTLRRMSVLNKVFMEHITDMMSTGEIEPEILNRDIEITNIKVTADFKQLNVHWVDHSSKYSDTEELLQNCAIKLRQELSRLRVTGCVPLIQFVKCKGVHTMKEVEQKLKQLSLEEDYLPSPYPDAIHHTVSAAESDAETEDDKNRQITDDFHVTIPVMRHDIFGLDHYRIMTKIKVSLSRTKKAVKNPGLDSSVKMTGQNISNFLNYEDEKEQFAKFLKERRKERRLRLKNIRLKHSQMYNFDEDNDGEDYEIDGDYYTMGDDYSNGDEDDVDEHCDEEFNKKC